MEKSLTWFIKGWIGLAILINIVSIVGIFMGAGNFWDGVSKVQEMFSPFNLWNFLAEIILFSPAFGAYQWRERIRATKEKKTAKGAGL